MRRLGAYPESLSVDFERAPLCQTVTHSMVTVVCPLKPTALPHRSRHSDRRLGNPARADIAPGSRCYRDHPFRQPRGCRHRTQPRIVRPPGAGTRSRTVRRRRARRGHRRVRRTCRSAGARPIFEEACDLSAGATLQDFLRKHTVDISPSFGSNAGLVFSGTPGHSVARIRAEAELAERARSIVEAPPNGSRAAPPIARRSPRASAGGGALSAGRSSRPKVCSNDRMEAPGAPR